MNGLYSNFSKNNNKMGNIRSNMAANIEAGTPKNSTLANLLQHSKLPSRRESIEKLQKDDPLFQRANNGSVTNRTYHTTLEYQQVPIKNTKMLFKNPSNKALGKGNSKNFEEYLRKQNKPNLNLNIKNQQRRSNCE